MVLVFLAVVDLELVEFLLEIVGGLCSVFEGEASFVFEFLEVGVARN